MKVTAILGSPTKDGNTCVLAREVLRGAADAGATVEEVFLADYRIEYCRGCISRNVEKMCMSTGKCIIDDDGPRLQQKLYASDGIVLASPAYGIRETARMKNFMVDRIGMYTVYTSALAGKYFVGVSTCGGIGGKKVAKELGSSHISGFHQRAYMTGYIGATLGNDRVEENLKALEVAYRLGQKLVRDIKTGKKYPFQKPGDRLITRLVVRRMIAKNIYQNKDGSMAAVYQNLLERGLLDPVPKKEEK